MYWALCIPLVATTLAASQPYVLTKLTGEAVAELIIGWGMRGAMPTHPTAIWGRLPSDVQHHILDDLSSILQEVMHEQIRTGDAAASSEEGAHLHPTIHPTSTDLQSGEPALAVRAPGASATPRVARRGRGDH